MKKYIYISLMALVAIAACSKEEASVTPEKTLKTFTALTDTDITKTSLNESFGIVWSTDDDVTVFPGANAAGVKFDVSETAREGLEATLSGYCDDSEVYYALSPDQSGATIADGAITASLETNQTAVAGSFGPTANLSVACSTDKTSMQFKNVGALVGITIGNEGITGLKLESINGEALSGNVTVSATPETLGSVISKSGVNYVEMSGSLAKDATYYFVVLPGTYANGFRVTLFKSGEFASFTKSGEQVLERNHNLDLGTFTGSKWKNIFTPGTAVTIKGDGAAEADQNVTYVGSDGYWNAINHANVTDYAYNYEIFTTLNANSPIHFESENGSIFTLSEDGTSVKQVASTSSVAYTTPDASGIYRIRMHLPSGVAEVRQILKASVYQNSCARENSSGGYMTLTYWEHGQWYASYFCLRRGDDGWANRYKFRFTLKNPATGDETEENYGRYSSDGGNPEAYPDNYSGASAFYVQPADGDNFEPGFKFVSTYENAENRYYARLGLNMNNRLGHYTHTITDILDNRIGNDEEVYIVGDDAVLETGHVIKMRYSSSFNNNYTNSNAGDESTVTGAAGYTYEAFCRLEAGKKFFFRVITATGQKHYELNDDASAVRPLYPGWGPISGYSGVSNTSVYRIRANFEDGTVSIDRISEARFLQLDRGTNQPLTVYEGNGVWRQDNAPFGWTHPNAWGNNERFKFWFQIYFVDQLTWQYLGRYDTNQYGVNIQTVTNGGWSWDNKLSAENDANLNTYLTDGYTATIRLKLNADGYTYEFSNIEATIPE